MTKSMTGHLTAWHPGQRLHAHLRTCLRCGSPEGDTILHAEVARYGDQLSLQPRGIGNQLCPKCKAGGINKAELDKLSAAVWPAMQQRGCPCCEAGLQWVPEEA